MVCLGALACTRYACADSTDIFPVNSENGNPLCKVNAKSRVYVHHTTLRVSERSIVCDISLSHYVRLYYILST